MGVLGGYWAAMWVAVASAEVKICSGGTSTPKRASLAVYMTAVLVALLVASTKPMPNRRSVAKKSARPGMASRRGVTPSMPRMRLRMVRLLAPIIARAEMAHVTDRAFTK
jgi:hypothetical protein